MDDGGFEEERHNMELAELYGQLGISETVLNYAAEVEWSLKERFEAIDAVAEFNQTKVIKAMQEARVSDIHFAATTGYGYNDLGRDTLEEVYAKAFHGEDSGASTVDLGNTCVDGCIVR